MNISDMVKKTAGAAIAVTAAARVTRFVVTDDLGQWWIQEPAREFAARFDPRWDKYVDGLSCPYCVSFWATALVMGSGAVMRWNRVWQFGAGVWAASYVVGHVSSRLDSDDEDDDTIKFSGLPMSGIEMHFGDTSDSEDD